MNKTYGRINWENYPSDETPLNESNLNKIDVATDEIDNRVITLDTTKATKEEVSTLVQDVTFEEKTGIITITKKNGSKITIDTQMEKIAVNFSYNAETQQIILTLIDGTKQYIDLTALITQYEFLDSDTVAFSIDSAGKVSAIVKEASIQEKHLRPNYLADIKVEVAKAQASQSAAAKSESNAKASETAAATSESNAAASATKAQSYATGGTNSRTGEDTDNAKYYSQQSAQSQSAAATSADTASTKAEEAAASAATAKTSADNAAGSANLANEKANSAANSATIAVSNSNAAQQYASNAAASADTAQNYAVADTDSAKYYYEQARRISESFSGALRPMGTVAFANLPALSEADGGSMYNISDQFTTTAEFKEGAGNTIPAGANVYKTEDGKWDILAGTPVTGVKGSAESEYRRGNVDITAENVGAVSQKEFDELNIGGTNLFHGTKEFEITNAKSFSNTVSSVTSETYNGLKIRKNLTAWNFYRPILSLEPGNYVFSGYVKGVNGLSTYIQVSAGDTILNAYTFSITSDWKRYSITFEITEKSDVTFFLESREAGEIYECGWKLEKGNKATDWSPAPEDLESALSIRDYNDTSKKIKVGWVGNSLSQGQILGVACYASGDDDIVKAKIKDVSKATFKNWLGTVSPSDGSNNYVKVFNSSNVNSSDDLTVNDLADQGFAAAMIAATEDSPIGSGWFHALNLGWGNSKNNWVSQIALGTQPNDGLYYRTTGASIVGKPWKRVLDSSNYTNYALKNENLSDIDLNNVTTTGIYHLTGKLTNNPLSCNATLFVDFSVGTPYQIFIPDYAYVMYKRTYSNGAWGSWVYLNDYIPISGTTSLAGSIVPNEDVAMDLGDSTHRFTNVYSSNITTGAIWMEHDSNAIYESGNDAANGNGGGLNNLVVRSWWGVSFTSNCAGGRYGGGNQTAVGIDCREGIVKAYNFAGLINGHSVNADVPENAKFTDTKGRYIGTTVTKPQDKTEMYITYLSSGYIVMAGKTVSKSYAMNTQYGNAFWAPFTIYLPPNIVKNIDSVNITPFAETGLISASINGYTSEQITGFVWSPQNETKSISFHVTVHGRA